MQHPEPKEGDPSRRSAGVRSLRPLCACAARGSRPRSRVHAKIFQF
ncbi:hypothetical protein SC1_03556 [Sphingopyxis sp. C-1]|nr:hypothetical protein SC1_03556 [Sphingopyxis sp. C-1]